ncbi:MAG TPA: DUF2127 domain-containing protein [Candidatus Bathyarchaeia archaeon]|nr:DUF2127 domain-containing protein [Candidatus Bathyarchaeia archaeon]
MTDSHNVRANAPHHDHHRGLRTVAVLEATKGVLVLLAAFGFAEILLRHIDLEDAAQSLLELLRIDPDRRVSQALVDFAGRMMDADLVTVLAIAFVYSSLRFLEAYGLWRSRVWAEWLAIISGAIYLPFELYNLIRRPTLAHWVILLVNIAIVLYIAWVRRDEIKEQGRAHQGAWAQDGD